MKDSHGRDYWLVSLKALNRAAGSRVIASKLASCYADWLSDPVVSKYLYVNSTRTQVTASRWLRGIMRSNDIKTFLVGIDSNGPFGHVRLSSCTDGGCLISIMIGKVDRFYSGRGGKMLEEVLAMAQKRGHFTQSAMIHKENAVSQMLFSSYGFHSDDCSYPDPSFTAEQRRLNPSLCWKRFVRVSSC
ncbi:MAG: hypothetical protein WCP97_03625 [bacterium]